MRNSRKSPARAVRGTRYGTRLPLLMFLLLLWGIAGCGGGQEEAETPPTGSSAMVPSSVEDSEAAAAAVETAAEPSGEHPAEHPAEHPMETGTPAAETAQVPVVQETAAPEPQSPAVTGTRAAAGGPYSLQLGSFRDRTNAEARAEQVAALGHEPEVTTAELAGVTYYRVLLRGIADRPAARDLGEELTAALGISYLVKRSD